MLVKNKAYSIIVKMVVHHYGMKQDGVYQAPYGERIGDKYNETLEITTFETSYVDRYVSARVEPDGTYMFKAPGSRGVTLEGKFTVNGEFTIWQVAISENSIEITPFQRYLKRIPGNPDGATPPDPQPSKFPMLLIFIFILVIITAVLFVIQRQSKPPVLKNN